MTTQSDVQPEQSGQPDHTDVPDVPGSGNDDSQLILPIVPTQADLQAQSDALAEQIAQQTPQPDAEAPWGRKADGTPRGKPGRPPKSEANTPKFDRLDSVSPARELPSATSSANSAGQPLRAKRPHVPNQVMPTADYVAMGQLAANLWFNAGEIMLGEDWQPDPNEPALIAGAFRNYFQAKEIKVMSPDLVLLTTLGMYAMARMRKPTVKSRIARGIEWLKSKTRRG